MPPPIPPPRLQTVANETGLRHFQCGDAVLTKLHTDVLEERGEA